MYSHIFLKDANALEMLSDIQLTIMLNSGCRRFGIVLESNVNISTDISLLK